MTAKSLHTSEPSLFFQCALLFQHEKVFNWVKVESLPFLVCLVGLHRQLSVFYFHYQIFIWHSGVPPQIGTGIFQLVPLFQHGGDLNWDNVGNDFLCFHTSWAYFHPISQSRDGDSIFLSLALSLSRGLISKIIITISLYLCPLVGLRSMKA